MRGKVCCVGGFAVADVEGVVAAVIVCPELTKPVPPCASTRTFHPIALARSSGYTSKSGFPVPPAKRLFKVSRAPLAVEMLDAGPLGAGAVESYPAA